NGDGTFTITYTDGSTFTSSDLTGPAGADGQDGTDGVGVQSTVDNGDGTFTITYTDGSTFTTSDLRGADGISAYEVWLAEGNTGTEQDFIDSLQGEQGVAGADG
ncbi:hypothetical protein, partial [Parapedobacter tibetensis]